MLRKKVTCLLCGLVLSLAISVPALAASANVRLGVTTGDNINLRDSASTDGTVITTISKDTKVVIIGSTGNFFKVSVNGKTGFMIDEFVIVYDSQSGRVNASDVVLRSGPSTESDKLAMLDDGDKVDVYGESDGFYRVACGDNYGFVSTKYISLSSSSKSKSDSGSSKEKSSGDDNSKSETKKADATRSVDPGNYTEEELDLIAKVVHAEASGMGSDAYEAVASVIYNRIESGKFPDSVEGVIFQSGQFSVVNPRERFLSINPSSGVEKAVERVFVDGKVTLPSDVLYFKSARLSKSWGARTYYDTVGGNMFYT